MIEAEAGAFERWGCASATCRVAHRRATGRRRPVMADARRRGGRLVLVAHADRQPRRPVARAVDALAAAALICCEDTRRTGRLLQHAGVAGTRWRSATSTPSRPGSARCSPCSATAATSPS